MTVRALILLGWVACSGGSPTSDTSGPETADSGTTVVKRPVEDVSDLLRPILKASGAPGLTAGSADSEGIRMLGSVGIRQVGQADEVTQDDLWHLGSDTKAMTATLVGTFVEDGVLSYDTTVADLFPKISADAAWSDVTMADLLRHQAGVGAISSPTWTRWAGPEDVQTLRADYVVEVLSAAPTAAQGAFVYSNGGYVVAGAALEAITGESWEALMQAGLFEPLGMTECGFGATPPGHPSGHSADGVPRPGGDNPAALGPAGTVHCTMRSWAKFAAANLAGPSGNAPILPAEIWQRIHGTTVDTYALGWFNVARPWASGPVVTHVGSNTMWYATLWVAPSNDRAYFAVTNSGHPDHLATAADAAIVELLSHDPGPE